MPKRKLSECERFCEGLYGKRWFIEQADDRALTETKRARLTAAKLAIRHSAKAAEASATAEAKANAYAKVAAAAAAKATAEAKAADEALVKAAKAEAAADEALAKATAVQAATAVEAAKWKAAAVAVIEADEAAAAVEAAKWKAAKCDEPAVAGTSVHIDLTTEVGGSTIVVVKFQKTPARRLPSSATRRPPSSALERIDRIVDLTKNDGADILTEMFEDPKSPSVVTAPASKLQTLQPIFEEEVARAHAIALGLDNISETERSKLSLYDFVEDFVGATRIAQTRFRQKEIGINTNIVRTYGTEHGFTEADLRNTIRHELAHVLTPWSKHNAVWNGTFVSLGGDGKRCYIGNALHHTKKVVLQCVNATATLNDFKDAAGHFHRLRHKLSPESYTRRKRCNLRGCGGNIVSFRP